MEGVVMKREILFKAKTLIEPIRWVYGDLINCYNGDKRIISQERMEPEGDLIEVNNLVNPETVCQLVKSFDKYKFWEGDKFKDSDGDYVYMIIEWGETNSKFCVNGYGYNQYLNENSGVAYTKDITEIDSDVFDVEDLEISELIGNIHD